MASFPAVHEGDAAALSKQREGGHDTGDSAADHRYFGPVAHELASPTGMNTVYRRRAPSAPGRMEENGMASEHFALPEGTHTVAMGVGDLNGILRGKRIPADQWPRVSESGAALSIALSLST